ncbi:hypothetical protein HPB47_024083 [Ixodes persulcatus]|uniref:Uncharacterized protein n=1 Tax=Ixodes persulcatus TaxID=34615 RepID=A0AC60Q5I2_IXOPE|nr:hypothetical protein HPB47_024083 [Ixodes persulcatus]
MFKNLNADHNSKLLEEINLTWHEGRILDEWKLSCVCPIPKPLKNPEKSHNTRPITLKFVIFKIVEKMVLARIDWIVDENETFHSAQSRFRKHLDTQDSLYLSGKASWARISDSTKPRNCKNNG